MKEIKFKSDFYSRCQRIHIFHLINCRSSDYVSDVDNLQANGSGYVNRQTPNGNLNWNVWCEQRHCDLRFHA